jgi:hypothetical protein
MKSIRYSCRILMKFEFSRQISEKKKLKYVVSSKSVQWESKCFMRANRQTDMMKLIVAFRNFANAPKTAHVSGKLITIFRPYKKVKR